MTELLPDEQVTKRTYDTHASLWGGTYAGKPGAWREEMHRYQELLPRGKILEVGAGNARDAKELVALGYDYVGTDISPAVLDIARKELPGYPFYEQSVYDLDFGGEQFDGFWAAAVLLHIPKSRIDRALTRIREVVHINAIGFIAIKDGSGEGRQIDEADGEKLDRFYAYWPKDTFAERVTQNGFKVVNYNDRPINEKTKWHCFFVEAS
ncbi:MAG TPA: class I SAM-dependent methyltransferase [Candidatus Saccharimonadales bacterium]|nr:class I SAM-dependent methyltransferase [Candidatus Saccharimonadales bacterium]